MTTNTMVARTVWGERPLYRNGRVGGAAPAGLLSMAMATAVLALAVAAPAPAGASEALARQRNCMNCHGIERKIVGPGFKQVAARYAGRADAPAYLAEKIVKGGAGAWGPVAMAANPQLSKDEAARLAAWVLSLK